MSIAAMDTKTLPAVECAPWCRDDDGHVSAWHQDDQACMGEQLDVTLTAEPLRMYEGKVEGADFLVAYLTREYNHRTPRVQLVRTDVDVALMTPAEAIELGRLLIKLGEQGVG